MITFKSVGHFFATSIKSLAPTLNFLEATKPVVETVTEVATAGTAVAPVAKTFEDLGYAVLGELSAVLNAGGDAAKAKLADAGLDVNVLNAVRSLLTTFEQVSTVAKKL